MKVLKKLLGKKNFVKMFIIIFLAFILFSPKKIRTIKLSSLLTYTRNYISNPEKLNYVPLEYGKTYSTNIDTPLNFFGTIILYFKPYGSREKIVEEDNLEGNQYFDNTTDINRFRILIQLYSGDKNELLYESEYEIYHEKNDSFEYPFGFPQQYKSMGNNYYLLVKPIFNNPNQESNFSIAEEDGSVVASTLYHLPANMIDSYKYDAFLLLCANLLQHFISLIMAFSVFLINIIFIILYSKEKRTTKYLERALILNYVIYSLLPIIFHYPSIIQNSQYSPSRFVLFLTIFYFYIYLTNNKKYKRFKLIRNILYFLTAILILDTILPITLSFANIVYIPGLRNDDLLYIFFTITLGTLLITVFQEKINKRLINI